MALDPMKPWFAAKSYGYGSGLPIAWQGWLVLAIYFAVIALATNSHSPLPVFAIVIPSTAILLIICVKRTAGGWRWRNGR